MFQKKPFRNNLGQFAITNLNDSAVIFINKYYFLSQYISIVLPQTPVKQMKDKINFDDSYHHKEIDMSLCTQPI